MSIEFDIENQLDPPHRIRQQIIEQCIPNFGEDRVNWGYGKVTFDLRIGYFDDWLDSRIQTIFIRRSDTSPTAAVPREQRTQRNAFYGILTPEDVEEILAEVSAALATKAMPHGDGTVQEIDSDDMKALQDLIKILEKGKRMLKVLKQTTPLHSFIKFSVFM